MFKRAKKWMTTTIVTAVTVSGIQFAFIQVPAHAQSANSVDIGQLAAVQAAAAKLKASVSSVKLDKGKTKKVTLTHNGKSLTPSKATWTTSKSTVATVKDGVITAKGKGTATITAKYSGESVKITVTVNEDGGLVAKDSKVTVEKGKTKTISLTYDGEKLTGSKATWSTSKSSVATVKNGVITAKAKGTATITAKYKGESVSITVTVTDGKDSKDGKLEASKTKYALQVGDKKSARLKYDGKTLTASQATWKTSKASVATVSKGKITAKGEGKATITATYKGQTVEIEVTVSPGDELEADNDKISVKAGKNETIKIKYKGKTISGKDVKWKSSKTAVATVKDGVVTGKKKGSATITAEYKGEQVKIRVKVS